ncbi:UNVERIFIED_CONTAM: protein ROS1C [Sesamum radiatum]|uniref:Protein ROS1C n=1 Tax=Sesamum radiatum TaxID=300843 RepID=A0AAW2QHF3_SESRA
MPLRVFLSESDANDPAERDIEDFGLDGIPQIRIDARGQRTQRLASVSTSHMDSSPIVIYSVIQKISTRMSISQEDTVYGTLLVPSRTAMRGIFPLDGTYFQANEVTVALSDAVTNNGSTNEIQLKLMHLFYLLTVVLMKRFADDESSEIPIKVPRESIWDLPRTILYCGSNISTICRGMKTHEVQNCFRRGQGNQRFLVRNIVEQAAVRDVQEARAFDSKHFCVFGEEHS